MPVAAGVAKLVPEYLAETDEVHEARILKLNIDKALRLLNWAPLLTLQKLSV